jgi:diacylglycerol O-acyltransferase
MKQLTGVDASFLYMESDRTFGHVSGVLIFERPYPEFDPYSAVYERYEAMVGHVEPMRRRLVEVPLSLDHPWWIEDPNFDLSFHIRALNLAKPGYADQLADQVARIHGRPMDRTRPLWEVYVIDGLGEGRWALLTKYHHATIDGASGQIMLEMVTSPTPDGDDIMEPLAWDPEPLPSNAELLRRALDNMVRNPARSFRVQMRLVRDVANAAGLPVIGGAAARASRAAKQVTRPAAAEPRPALPTTPAPPTPWNKAISQHRRFAIRSSSLSNIKAIKEAANGTVNDVVMAICAGGLRTYLLRHDALPDRPLRAMVPVSIRTGNETDPWTNRVSALIAELPTDEADPLRRVARCREAMQAAKRQFELVPAETLVDMSQTSSPLLTAAAMRLSSRLGLTQRISSVPFNLTISNVPGPRQPLYMAGAQLQHQFPVSIVTDGQGLNITVVSYLDRLDFGVIADRELVPDLWDMADDLINEITVLKEATGVEWIVEPSGPYKRLGRPGAAKRGAQLSEELSRAEVGDSGGKPATATPAKKATRARKAPAKKAAPPKKAAARRAPTKKSAAAVRSPAAENAPAATQTPAKNAPAATQTPAAKKASAAKKAPAKRAPAKRAPAKKAAAS